MGDDPDDILNQKTQIKLTHIGGSEQAGAS